MEIRKLEELERADTRPLYETVFSRGLAGHLWITTTQRKQRIIRFIL